MVGIVGLVLSICALLFSAWLYLELQKKLSSEDVVSKLALASEELSKTSARQLRAIETEWGDMYQKFSRLAGRVDKLKGLEAAQAPVETVNQFENAPRRSDLIRKHRGGSQR